MSTIVVESTACPGIPRLSDVRLTTVEEIDHNLYVEQEYFCSQGHSFSLTFLPVAEVPPFWECPKCETIAFNFPPDAY